MGRLVTAAARGKRILIKPARTGQLCIAAMPTRVTTRDARNALNAVDSAREAAAPATPASQTAAVHASLVDVLLERRASLDLQNSNGYTAH